MSAEQIDFSVGKVVTAAAGATGEHVLHTVTAAKMLKIKRITVHFPSGSQYYLQISFFRGAEQVYPNEGYIAGDDSVYVFNADIEYLSGEAVKVKYTNADSANQHSCYILIEGERT